MWIIDWLCEFLLIGDYGRIFGGVGRSPKWESFKRDYERLHPKECAICGSTSKCQLHHKLPYHLHLELELDPQNVLWLCEASGNHHLWFGHLGNFQSFNSEIEVDAKVWNSKIKNRPL